MVVLWAILAAPFALGERTLVLRDVFSTHLPLKWFGAHELASGRIPVFNPTWALGQPFSGNPNALPFYPGNLLYLMLPFWVAFNLHYFLHWLLAFFTMRALARALGQSATAAVLAGIAYAGSGYLFSCMNFYNLLTVAAWMPLVLAGLVRGGRRGGLVAGLAAGMVLLGGEPVTAALAAPLALMAAFGGRPWRRGLILLTVAAGLGLLVAAPQIVASLRVVPASYRAAHGIDLGLVTTNPIKPVLLLELLLPLPWGTPAPPPFSYWATKVFPFPPYIVSLHLGVVAAVLLLVGFAKSRRWVLASGGALLVGWLLSLSATVTTAVTLGLFRYPQKLIFPFTLAAAVAAGFGLDAVRERPRAGRPIALAGAVVGVIALALAVERSAFAAWLGRTFGPEAAPPLLHTQAMVWVVGLLLAAGLLGAAGWAVARGRVGWLPVLELVGLVPLLGLLPSDAVATYREPPRFAREVKASRGVVSLTGVYPAWEDRPPYRLQAQGVVVRRRIDRELLEPGFAIEAGLASPLAPDLEGLTQPLQVYLSHNLALARWPERVRWLRRLGVGALVRDGNGAPSGLAVVDQEVNSGVRAQLLEVPNPRSFVFRPRAVRWAKTPLAAWLAVARGELRRRRGDELEPGEPGSRRVGAAPRRDARPDRSRGRGGRRVDRGAARLAAALACRARRRHAAPDPDRRSRAARGRRATGAAPRAPLGARDFRAPGVGHRPSDRPPGARRAGRAPERRVRRFLALWVAPTLALLAVVVVPLASGARTLLLRDVMNTHLLLRTYLAEAWRAGHLLPLIDPLRAGGQGLLGNPNAVPLYPDNLLLFVGSTLWQLNAHFWLHWLVALGAAFWLGREWGLERRGAMAAAVAYAFSGYFVSQLNFYNAVAGVALAPALAAALLAAARPVRRGRSLALFGAIWALELLAGDPVVAAIALGSALALALSCRERAPWGGAALALVAGTLVAAPQLVELARLLPGSYRGFWGYEAAHQGVASPRPAALLDLVLPLFFGRPNFGESWGNGYFGGFPALYFSLAPGLVAMSLAWLGGRVGRGAERRERWAVVLVGTALLFGFTGGVVGTLLGHLPGGTLFRYPVKFVLPGMLALALLAGRGLERALTEPAAARRLPRLLVLLLGVELVLFLVFAVPGNALEGVFRRVFARGLDETGYLAHRFIWVGTALLQIATLLVAILAVRWLARGRHAAAALLLPLQVASQLWLFQTMLPTDQASYYARRPPLLDLVPHDAVVTHGRFGDLFGTGYFTTGPYPDQRFFWRERRAHDELYGASGLAAGLHFEFDSSPEGLDSFLVEAIGQAMRNYRDPWRLQILRATGVDRLLLDRALEGPGLDAMPFEAGRGDPPMRVYHLDGALPAVALPGDVVFAPNVNRAIERVLDPTFDPRQKAVVAGAGESRVAPPGSARIVRQKPAEEWIEADSQGGGVLVVRRAWLPIWRVEVDGKPAKPVVANLTRLAVGLPPGPHEVRFFVSRTPLKLALAGSLIGLLGLVAMARRRPSGVPPGASIAASS